MKNCLLLAAFAITALVLPSCGSDTGPVSNGPTILAVTPTVSDNGDGTFNVDLTVDFDDSVTGDLVDAFTFETSDNQVDIVDQQLPQASGSPITISGITLPADENGQASLGFHIELYGATTGLGSEFDGTIDVN